MSDVKISILCPGCEERIGFPGHDAGTVQACPECGGWVDVPELSRSSELKDPYHDESVRQFEENARLLVRSDKSHEEWDRQLKQSAKYQADAENAFGRLAALVTRWEALTGRLERVIQRIEEK